MSEERDLKGFEEAEKIDAANTPFFKPEANKEYLLGFNSWRLIEKPIPDFNDKTKLVKKVILELGVDFLNEMKVDKEWGIVSGKLRNKFKDYCESGQITKGIFKYKFSGVGKATDYTLTWISSKEGGESITPPTSSVENFV